MEYKGYFAQGTSGCNYHAAKQKKRQVPFLENFEQSVLRFTHREMSAMPM